MPERPRDRVVRTRTRQRAPPRVLPAQGAPLTPRGSLQRKISFFFSTAESRCHGRELSLRRVPAGGKKIESPPPAGGGAVTQAQDEVFILTRDIMSLQSYRQK